MITALDLLPGSSGGKGSATGWKLFTWNDPKVFTDSPTNNVSIAPATSSPGRSLQLGCCYNLRPDSMQLAKENEPRANVPQLKVSASGAL